MLPTGAVVAFDLPSGCPDGFTNVGVQDSDRFAGRSIIAAGPRVDRDLGQKTVRRNFNDQGGLEEFTLTSDEIPPLSFSLSVSEARTGRDKVEAGGDDYGVVSARQVELQGSTQGTGNPFPTISPFIALHYCRKD
ncbi:hypothetical protein [Mesorhizobium helmanticense]|uniref:hypothetical protein n=1 Tax=Mesorhizobium helmanticense TaxID=1776423 RepID=UPI0011B2491C|nr:hypothetical protein [Mesorhizobium helmanticense]